MDQVLCPFNRFKPCVGQKCGASIKVDENTYACSLQFIGHELYMLASAQLDGKTPLEDQHGNQH